MTLNLSVPGQNDLRPRISVFGIGGAGGNAVNNMIEKQLEGAEFVAANTDAQALQQSNAKNKIQMGVKVTEGLGAGARASVGAAAAEETIDEIVDHLAGSHMAFITAGMGGGTGTGAAPIIAQAARELGVLTVGVVTKPFQFEGAKRMRQAEEGVEALQKVVDTLIIIPNQNLFRIANEKTTFADAFNLADDVLYQGVKGITDLMVRPGLINLDFADVRAVMDEMGKAMMGTGEASGEDRAIQAAEKAIANPLLDEISLRGAKGVLINITGGQDLTLFELDEAANRIREEVDPDANIIVGSTVDEDLEGVMRVSVVATGIDANDISKDTPLPRRSMAEPLATEVQKSENLDKKNENVSDNNLSNQSLAEPPSEVIIKGPEETIEDSDKFVPDPVYQSTTDELRTQINVDDSDLFNFIAPRSPDDQISVVEKGYSSSSLEEESEKTMNENLNKNLETSHFDKTFVDNKTDQMAETSEQTEIVQTQKTNGRFGINNLISRMTGTSTLAVKEEGLEQDTSETNNTVTDKVEIPAFLRRQAN